MNLQSKISYFPVIDLTLFSIGLIGLIVAYFALSINIWIIIASSFFLYFFTIAKSWIIKLDRSSLTLISLNLFSSSHLIDLTKIIKIASTQSFDYDTVATGEAYTVFNKNYEIEYLDKTGRKKTVAFSINNTIKEQKIMEAIQSYSKDQGI